MKSCKFRKSCTYYDKDSFTCNSGNPNFCGKFREATLIGKNKDKVNNKNEPKIFL